MSDKFLVHGVALEIPSSGWFKIKVKADLRYPSKCKKCGKDIFWARTKKGKIMPIQPQGKDYVCHYNHCKSQY